MNGIYTPSKRADRSGIYSAVIWAGINEDLGHEHPWNVSIDRPEWDEDRGFEHLFDAYEFIEDWARGRGVKCAVEFGYLAGRESWKVYP